MAEIKTTIFDQTAEGAADTWSGNIKSVDLRKGGQFGVLPMIGGIDSDKNVHEWMYNQSYQRRDLIAIVLETPRGFDLMPEPAMWHEAVKAMFEVHSKTIDGLDSSLTVTSNERDSGLSGAKFKEPTDVTRAESNVTLGLGEKYGVPFEILLDTWIRFLIKDPDTKEALINTLPGAENIKVYDPSYWTATVLFIEPDPLMRNSVHSWFVSNLYPGANPEIIGKKDKTAGREMKDISVEFGGFAIPHTNKRVMDLADKVLNNLKLYTRTPDDIILPTTSVSSKLVGKDQDIYYESTGASTYEGTDKTVYEAGATK